MDFISYENFSFFSASLFTNTSALLPDISELGLQRQTSSVFKKKKLKTRDVQN